MKEVCRSVAGLSSAWHGWFRHLPVDLVTTAPTATTLSITAGRPPGASASASPPCQLGTALHSGWESGFPTCMVWSYMAAHSRSTTEFGGDLVLDSTTTEW